MTKLRQSDQAMILHYLLKINVFK